MSMDVAVAPDYRAWLGDLKARFRQVQLKAAVAVNTELLRFYLELGVDIVARQASQSWGSGFLERLSQDLMQEFPEIKGFSKRNLEQIRRWYNFWSTQPAITKQAASQLLAIPWWHNVVIITKCQNHAEALYYVQQTQAHGWSRSVLTHQIESGLWQREGQALSNFTQFVAEYALSDMSKPLGLATYNLSHTLPEALRDKLPSIEAMEAELGVDLGGSDEQR